MRCCGQQEWLFLSVRWSHNGADSKAQLLPTDANTGVALPNVDPIGAAGENKWGVFGTAAVQGDLNRLFVGLGGYDGIGDAASTPFIRVMDTQAR